MTPVPEAVMPQPEDMKKGILRLPLELLQHILTCVPDPRSLACAIRTSRTLYISFKENEQHIIAAVLMSCVGAGVLHEAKLTRDCAPPVLATELSEQPPDLDEDLQDKMDTYVANFLRNEPRADNLARPTWSLSDAVTLGAYHTEVILPLKDMFIQASSDPACCEWSEEITKSLEKRPLSYLEEERICRALYRFELFRRLFGCYAWRSDELIDLAMVFLARFSPWEIAQLGCIHDFLGRQVASVFNDVARHDIAWGEFGVMFDADAADGTIQHLLTLGLREILAITRLQDCPYDVREKFFNPEENVPIENDDFLNSALVEINHRARPTVDEGLYDSLLSVTPLYADADSGPQEIWNLSRPQDGSSLALFERHDWISRRWAYLLWDHARLLELDRRGTPVLTLPWEPAANPLSEPQTPSQQEREASWQIRSSLYTRGARGWWAQGDESKVRWPDKRVPSRHEQLAIQKQEGTVRHTPESLEDAKRYWTAQLTQRD